MHRTVSARADLLRPLREEFEKRVDALSKEIFSEHLDDEGRAPIRWVLYSYDVHSNFPFLPVCRTDLIRTEKDLEWIERGLFENVKSALAEVERFMDSLPYVREELEKYNSMLVDSVTDNSILSQVKELDNVQCALVESLAENEQLSKRNAYLRHKNNELHNRLDSNKIG